MAYGEIIGNGNPDGSNFGLSSTSKIGFFGLTTPVVRSTLGNAAINSATSAYYSAVTSTSCYGFSTAAQFMAATALLNELRALMLYYGLAA
jgi:hypothetical protein